MIEFPSRTLYDILTYKDDSKIYRRQITHLHVAQDGLILSHQFHEVVDVPAVPLLYYMLQEYTDLFEADEEKSSWIYNVFKFFEELSTRGKDAHGLLIQKCMIYDAARINAFVPLTVPPPRSMPPSPSPMSSTLAPIAAPGDADPSVPLAAIPRDSIEFRSSTRASTSGGK